ncbi:MAG: hypothetical protein JNM17_34035 [Archangium sp.]|nr:hypothetical protein [Archangium sp.]
MRRAWLVMLVMAACEPLEGDDLPGQLASVTVTSLSDDCSPLRFVGDAGVQFYGTRPDGGVVFTMSQRAQFSSASDDGGLVESVQRQTAPFIGDGRTNVASGDACVGVFSAWRVDAPFVLRNPQEWPGADACPAGPGWLPRMPCTSERVFTFTPISECNLKCVTISAAGEVTCDC